MPPTDFRGKACRKRLPAAYLAAQRAPVVEATPEEIAAIERGRRDFERGDYYTTEELLALFADPRDLKVAR